MFRCVPNRQSPISEAQIIYTWAQIDEYGTAHSTVGVSLVVVSPAEDILSEDISVLLNELAETRELQLVEVDRLSGLQSIMWRSPQEVRLVL